MATAPDISKLSYTELRALAEQAKQAAEAKRVEEIKVLADAYAKKSTAAGFSIEEAIEALKPYLPATKRKYGKSTAEAKYRDPANAENTWSGKGKHPRWLTDYLAAGKTKDDFLI